MVQALVVWRMHNAMHWINSYLEILFWRYYFENIWSQATFQQMCCNWYGEFALCCTQGDVQKLGVAGLKCQYKLSGYHIGH